jgi:hypothetical protein
MPWFERRRAEIARREDDRIEHLVSAETKALLEEPFRIEKIVPYAPLMTFSGLYEEVTRRITLPPPREFERRVALKALARAVRHPDFEVAWDRYIMRMGCYV